MPKFNIYINGVLDQQVKATGNLQALVARIGTQGMPNYPMHTIYGVLCARIAGDVVMVHDAEQQLDVEVMRSLGIRSSSPVLALSQLKEFIKPNFGLSEAGSIAHVF